MEWISVEDRLPEVRNDRYSDDVLVFARGTHWIAYVWQLRIDGEMRWGFFNEMSPESHEVTHWMPLPQPPKED